MPRHCPFPIKCSDNRRCYRTGYSPGFSLVLLLVAVLAGYAGLSDAAPISAAKNHQALAALEKAQSGIDGAPAVDRSKLTEGLALSVAAR